MNKNKKLLLIGGKPIASCDIIDYVKSKGIYTIVTDNLSVDQSLAKQTADEHWNISTANVDDICNAILKNNVDAVFTGIHEFNIEKTLEICEKLNLPFYSTKEQFYATSNKKIYKQLFVEYNIPTIKEYDISTKDKIQYPIIVKPVDGSGGYGVNIVSNEEDLATKLEDSLKHSKIKEVLIEEYLSLKEVTMFYVIQDGNIFLSAMADRHTANGNEVTIPLPVAYIYPSKHLGKYIINQNQKVIEAFKSIGLKNGMLFLQAFVSDNEFKIYDIGFRLTGTQEYNIIEKICNYNPLEMLVDYSLTGKFGKTNIENLVDPFFKGKCASNITFLIKPCVIGKIDGVKLVEELEGVIKVVINHNVGEVISISDIGTLNQVVLRVFAITNSKKEMKELINKITNTIEVYSADKDNVLLSSFNVENI